MTTQLQQDFDAFFANTKPGETVSVDGNKYIRGPGDTAQVIDSTGRTVRFTSATDPLALAKQSSAIGASYNTKYTAEGAAAPYYQQRLNQAVNPPMAGGLDAFGSNLEQNIGNLEGFSTAPSPRGGSDIVVTTPSGRTYTVSPYMDPTAVAQHIPELAYAANQQYGTQFHVSPVGPSYFTNFLPQLSIGGQKLKDMDPNSPERQRITNLYQTQYGFDPFDQTTPRQPFDPTTNPNFAAVRGTAGAPDTQAPAGLLPPSGGTQRYTPNYSGGVFDGSRTTQPTGAGWQQQAGGFNLEQLRSDFAGFFANTPEGGTQQVGDLLYTRGPGNTGTVTLPNGLVIQIDSNTDPMDLAGIAGIGQSYTQNYGYNPGGGMGAGPGGGAGGGGLLGQAQIGEVATYNPYTSEVEYDELVQNRMAEALESPYANLQRKRALDEMNTRGLLNSSLATQAADRASLDAALPIAQQDAATMTENRLRANESINKALETNTAARNQMTKANMDALNAFGLDAQQYAQQRDLTMAEHAQQLKLADFDRDTRERLTAMSINSEQFMQSQSLNQQDREFVIGSVQANNEYIMGAITNIMKIEGLTEQQRATLMEEIGAVHYANLQLLQGLTGVAIDWNAFGTGNNVVSNTPTTTETGSQNTDYGYLLPEAAFM